MVQLIKKIYFFKNLHKEKSSTAIKFKIYHSLRKTQQTRLISFYFNLLKVSSFYRILKEKKKTAYDNFNLIKDNQIQNKITKRPLLLFYLFKYFFFSKNSPFYKNYFINKVNEINSEYIRIYSKLPFMFKKNLFADIHNGTTMFNNRHPNQMYYYIIDFLYKKNKRLDMWDNIDYENIPPQTTVFEQILLSPLFTDDTANTDSTANTANTDNTVNTDNTADTDSTDDENVNNWIIDTIWKKENDNTISIDEVRTSYRNLIKNEFTYFLFLLWSKAIFFKNFYTFNYINSFHVFWGIKNFFSKWLNKHFKVSTDDHQIQSLEKKIYGLSYIYGDYEPKTIFKKRKILENDKIKKKWQRITVEDYVSENSLEIFFSNLNYIKKTYNFFFKKKNKNDLKLGFAKIPEDFLPTYKNKARRNKLFQRFRHNQLRELPNSIFSINSQHLNNTLRINSVFVNNNNIKKTSLLNYLYYNIAIETFKYNNIFKNYKFFITFNNINKNIFSVFNFVYVLFSPLKTKNFPSFELSYRFANMFLTQDANHVFQLIERVLFSMTKKQQLKFIEMFEKFEDPIFFSLLNSVGIYGFFFKFKGKICGYADSRKQTHYIKMGGFSRSNKKHKVNFFSNQLVTPNGAIGLTIMLIHKSENNK